jgi:hypothetical protein
LCKGEDVGFRTVNDRNISGRKYFTHSQQKKIKEIYRYRNKAFVTPLYTMHSEKRIPFYLNIVMLTYRVSQNSRIPTSERGREGPRGARKILRKKNSLFLKKI